MKVWIHILLFLFSSQLFAQCDTFFDDFSRSGNVNSDAGYKQNDGNKNFKTGWKEHDPDQKFGRPANNVKITSGHAHLERDAFGGNSEFYRFASLSSYDKVTLSFDYTAVKNDRVNLFYTINGRDWKKFLLKSSIHNSSSGHLSFNLPKSLLKSNFGFKFKLPSLGIIASNYVGFGKKFTVDNFKLEADCNSLDEIAALKIEFSTVAQSCDQTVMTVTACADVNCSQVAINTKNLININNTPAQGSLTKHQASGNLQVQSSGKYRYTFASQDKGVAKFQFNTSIVDRYQFRAYMSSPTRETIEYLSLASGYQFNFDPQNPLPAMMPRNLQVSMMLKNSAGGGCGIDSTYSGNKSIKAWIIPQANDQSSVASKIGTADLPKQKPSNENVTLSFNNGVANIGLATFDVGHYALALEDSQSNYFDENNNPVVLQGESNNFISYPFALTLDVAGQRQASGNNADNHSNQDKAFIASGDNFPLELSAVAWQASDDVNSDGVPDSGANLYDNAVLTGFNQDNSLIQNFQLAGVNHQPSLGSAGLLTSNSTISFLNGKATLPVSYSEVGAVDISATLNYLSQPVTGELSSLGRFIPYQFSLAANAVSLRNGTIGWSCPFTYQGQELSYNIAPEFTFTAQDRAGNTLHNYVADYFKFEKPVGILATNLTANDLILAVNDLAEFEFDDVADFDGSFIVRRVPTVNGQRDSFIFNKIRLTPDSRDVQFPADLSIGLTASQLTDSDGVCLRSSSGSCKDFTVENVTGANIRYGRVTLQPVSGAVTSRLFMPINMQHYAQLGSSTRYEFVLNTDDSCTQFSAQAESGSNIQFTNFLLSDFASNLAAGETTASFVDLSNGHGYLSLSAAGAGNDGRVKVSIKAMPWLKGEFDGATAGLEYSSAWASFGTVPNKSPIIYRLESYRN